MSVSEPEPAVAWFDSHCHLQDQPEPASIIARARSAGVYQLVCVGTDLEQSRRAVRLAEMMTPSVWATVGLHPHDAKQGVDGIISYLEGAHSDRIVAVGECGLDYHYDHSPRSSQHRAFAAQVILARSHDLTLVVHTREAWPDTFEIIEAEGTPDRVVFHCFTGGPEEVRRCLDLGAYVSFSGIVTFPGATDVQRAAAVCPLDKLLVETDSPLLAPVPHRGRRNEPSYVPLVGSAIASIKGVPVEDVALASRAAAEAAFALGQM